MWGVPLLVLTVGGGGRVAAAADSGDDGDDGDDSGGGASGAAAAAVAVALAAGGRCGSWRERLGRDLSVAKEASETAGLACGGSEGAEPEAEGQVRAPVVLLSVRVPAPGTDRCRFECGEYELEDE